MRRLVLSAPLALLLAFPAIAEVQREIVVTGEGRVEVSPDLATIRAGVEAQADTAAEALDSSAEAMRAVLAALEAAGVEARDMQTSQLGLEPVYRQRDNGDWTPEVMAYRARNMLTVRLREIAAVGAIVDEMMAAGVNRIDGIGFELDDRRSPLDEARRDAVRDGRARAELYAEAAGVTLGPVLGIRETQPFDRPFPMAARMEMAMDGAIAEGSVEVMAMVEIVYAIEDEDEDDGDEAE